MQREKSYCLYKLTGVTDIGKCACRDRNKKGIFLLDKKNPPRVCLPCPEDGRDKGTCVAHKVYTVSDKKGDCCTVTLLRISDSNKCGPKANCDYELE